MLKAIKRKKKVKILDIVLNGIQVKGRHCLASTIKFAKKFSIERVYEDNPYGVPQTQAF